MKEMLSPATAAAAHAIHCSASQGPTILLLACMLSVLIQVVLRQRLRKKKKVLKLNQGIHKKKKTEENEKEN